MSGRALTHGLLGLHVSRAHGGYDIWYREDQWDEGKEHTVLHETYEIIQERLFPHRPNGEMARFICRDADQFAAAVLMQPQCFAPVAEASGLDQVELQLQYRCSYAMVTNRVTEVLHYRPLVAILYERRERLDPVEWPVGNAFEDFRVKISAYTPGGRGLSRTALIGGERGRMPARGLAPMAGSPAESVVRNGVGLAIELPPHCQGTGALGVAVMARPAFWNGRLAKIAVVAVPYSDRTTLLPHRARLRATANGPGKAQLCS